MLELHHLKTGAYEPLSSGAEHFNPVRKVQTSLPINIYAGLLRRLWKSHHNISVASGRAPKEQFAVIIIRHSN